MLPGVGCPHALVHMRHIRMGGGGGGRKQHTMPHTAQPQHTNHWAPRTQKRHQQEHQPQRPTERSDPTQHAKRRTGDCPGPRKETTTRRNVTQGDLEALPNQTFPSKVRLLCSKCKGEEQRRAGGGGGAPCKNQHPSRSLQERHPGPPYPCALFLFVPLTAKVFLRS